MITDHWFNSVQWNYSDIGLISHLGMITDQWFNSVPVCTGYKMRQSALLVLGRSNGRLRKIEYISIWPPLNITWNIKDDSCSSRVTNAPVWKKAPWNELYSILHFWKLYIEFYCIGIILLLKKRRLHNRTFCSTIPHQCTRQLSVCVYEYVFGTNESIFSGEFVQLCKCVMVSTIKSML